MSRSRGFPRRPSKSVQIFAANKAIDRRFLGYPDVLKYARELRDVMEPR